MLIGLDFDNTLICYDTLFHRVALEQELIPADLPARKNCVRDYLRSHGQEDKWTQMQGEVYGARISEAEPFPGMLETLKRLSQSGIPLCIVSHKTRTPYCGPAYDLHKAARAWLTDRGFFSPLGLNWREEQVFFEVTKQDKSQRITNLGCSHYVDDLPEILEMLPDSIQKILFSSADNVTIPETWWHLRNWYNFPELIGVSV
ncbi:MAG: hypothetical protein SAJ12_07635 [Jaaginema sp. PMC 1079.18]|nr:hypothetical protein [Jaaginema sp. PMC 1080.18]MEC4850869.1 hypothetical protein [Jaaginema sp. PMC 1079.18]